MVSFIGCILILVLYPKLIKDIHVAAERNNERDKVFLDQNSTLIGSNSISIKLLIYIYSGKFKTIDITYELLKKLNRVRLLIFCHYALLIIFFLTILLRKGYLVEALT